MTYRGEALSLAAARATLKVLAEEPVTERLAEIGAHVREQFHVLCRRTGVHCSLIGPDARLTFAFDNDGGRPWEWIRLLFVQECLKRGVLTNGNLLPSYAVGHDDIARSLDAFEGALETVARAVDAGRNSDGDRRGVPSPIVSKGFVTIAGEDREGLHIHGWMLVGGRAPERFEFAGAGGTITGDPVERPDLASGYPDAESPEKAGYAAFLPTEEFATDSGYEFSIVARDEEETLFRCHVVWARPPAGQAVGPNLHWTGDGAVSI
jgi:hypothetical protein